MHAGLQRLRRFVERRTRVPRIRARAELPNVILVPHIASASTHARSGMAVLAACNVVGILERYPLFDSAAERITKFIDDDVLPRATPNGTATATAAASRHTPSISRALTPS